MSARQSLQSYVCQSITEISVGIAVADGHLTGKTPLMA
ncbi:hypothetical protein T1E_1038 [Pseudomonas putida DOT-T1E]|uniref:Uncharacterized protein n=1 Tax=Pseudomonas putida (strain DOT-T1E) TaxID=1196325 RepID=I7C1F2_PSEPT|nr:hypothetical protein T1E_1038 [Pseudomonas putida DOT-T1E]